MIIKLLLSAIICVTPINMVRVFLYRTLLNYDIDYKSAVSPFVFLMAVKVKMRHAKINMFNYIRLNEFEMAPQSFVGKFNYISNLRLLKLGRASCILHKNFIGGTFGTEVSCGRECLTLAEESQISISNFIDVSDYVEIGNAVVIAGCGTQIWTHGFDHRKIRACAPVILGNRIFVGSASILVQGVTICDDVIIGAGSVVHKDISESGLYASNQLRKVK